MSEKQKKSQKSNTQNPESSANAGFFQVTRQQISQNINKYENAISKDNTVFQSRYNENSSSTVVFKKRINSLDSAMLENAAYNVLDDKELKYGKRIETVEKHLSEIDEKIIVAQTVNDIASLEELRLQKRILTENLKSLQIEYNRQKSAPDFLEIIGTVLKFPPKLTKFIFDKIKFFVTHSAVFRHIKPLARSFMVRDTIAKLNQINKSVDELVNMQVPFGEQDARYATLVSQLSSAGVLHSQILKEFET